VRAALSEFTRHQHLLGLDVAQYNPDKDPDASGAKKIVDLLVEALSARLEALASPSPDSPAEATEASSTGTTAEAAASES
jgi:hypothetical protein